MITPELSFGCSRRDDVTRRAASMLLRPTTGGPIRRALGHLCYVHVSRCAVHENPTNQLVTEFQ